MPVIVDAMGGDHAPEEVVQGAIEAAEQAGVEIVLVGKKPELDHFQIDHPDIRIVHAESVVEMDDHPARSVRTKRDSSIAVAIRMARDDRSSPVVCAGNTGATMANALHHLGRIPGIDRPAIATIIPTLRDKMVAIDCGANVDCKPVNLVQFAAMGSAYATHVLGKERPRIGLLNNGSEKGKGNEQARSTQQLLEESDLNFVGNVEGSEIYRGVVDVMVTDGFVGNIFLKTSEGMSEAFFHLIEMVEQTMQAPDRAGSETPLSLLRKKLERFDQRSPEHASAPLLGVNGCVVISHGSARAATIRNAILQASEFAGSGTLDAIGETCADRGELS